MIQINNINLSFGNKQVFSNLTLNIKKGEKVILNAPSGKGKSSLLKIIMGFVEPGSGDVVISDKPLNPQNIKEIRAKIAYLPQDISFPKMRVEAFINNVLDYESNRCIIYDKSKVEEMLVALKLPIDTLQQSTDSLSGGERQRIGILIMQLLNREIFLLDEVTSALNGELKVFIADYFLKMEQTIIVVSHDEVWQQNNLRKVEW
jgi:putative ABC transport system ATP-binding protein